MLEVFPEGKEGFSHFRITGDSSGLPLIYSFHPGWVEGSQPTHTLLFFPITNRRTQKWVPRVHAQLAPAHLVICVHLLLTPFSDRKKLTVSWDIWVRVRVFTEMCSTIGWDDSLPIQMHLYLMVSLFMPAFVLEAQDWTLTVFFSALSLSFQALRSARCFSPLSAAWVFALWFHRNVQLCCSIFLRVNILHLRLSCSHLNFWHTLAACK